MSNYNLPPGVTVSMLPGYDEPPWYPTIRCAACGCWIGYGDKHIASQETHYRTYHCKGGEYPTCEDWLDNDVSHKPHDWQDYDGITTWYKCPHCGAETPIKEY